MKQVAPFAGFALGMVFIVGGLVVAWNRLAPIFLPNLTFSQVVATPTPSQAVSAQIQKESGELQTILTNFSQGYPGRVSAVVTDLSNNATASAGADNVMVSASLYKIYVAWGVYKMVDAGDITTSSDTPGLSDVNIGDCLYTMITVSDNDCGYALGTMVGWADLDAQLSAFGLTHTNLNNYDNYGNLQGDKTTTAGDVAKFMAALYKGNLLSKDSTNAFLSLLKQDQLNTWLPSGLPGGTVIAHKTGALYDVVHDAGIVYTGKAKYLIVVMTHGWQDPVGQPPAAFADISSKVWAFFTS